MIVMTEEERRRAWEKGPTDVAGLARRADRLAREAREAQATARRGGRGAPAVRESDEFIHALHDDLKSSAEGKRFGKLYSHCPYRLAAHLGLAVERVPAGQLRNPARPSAVIAGLLLCQKDDPAKGVIYLSAGLGPYEEARTLGHELGHALNFRGERVCDQFASAFLAIDDSDTSAARWKALDDKCIRRERQRQIARGKSLQAAASRRY